MVNQEIGNYFVIEVFNKTIPVYENKFKTYFNFDALTMDEVSEFLSKYREEKLEQTKLELKIIELQLEVDARNPLD